ncbi:MAG: hypothetical protein Q4F97_09370 [Bacteroidales bacterium]|nr:hypothetical protein [Bacteroidales bacterium]
MKGKFIFLFLLSLISTFVFAESNDSFDDYINHFKEMTIPMEINSDSIPVYFPRGDEKTYPQTNFNIPNHYVEEFICNDTIINCQDINKEVFYTYGFKFTLNSYIVAVVSIDCSNCYSEFGIGVDDCLMIVYNKNGEIISQKIIGKYSFQHFWQGKFESGDDSYILSLEMKNGKILKLKDKMGKYLEGDLKYIQFNINSSGKIEEKNIKTKKCIVESGLNKYRMSYYKILEEW